MSDDKIRSEAPYAFIMDVTKYDGQKVRLGVPIGMTAGELEEILHEKYWTPPTELEQKP